MLTEEIVDTNNNNDCEKTNAECQANTTPTNNKQDDDKNTNNSFIMEHQEPISIEAIAFEGVKTIKGTENYKFIIKVYIYMFAFAVSSLF